MDSVPILRDGSQPWDSPINKEMAMTPRGWFSYPARWGSKTRLETNAFAITGPGTAFGDGETMPKSIKNVPPQTILVAEVRSSGIHWMQPGDFDIRTMPHTINVPDGKGISSRYPGGFHVLFADGKVWFLSEKIPFDTLKKFFTVADARQYDREKELGPFILDRCQEPSELAKGKLPTDKKDNDSKQNGGKSRE